MAEATTAPIPSLLTSRRFGNLPSVAAGADNLVTIPLGDNVHSIRFAFRGAGGALTRAQLITDVALVQLQLNGELIYDRTATEALDEYKEYHDPNVALADPVGDIIADCMNHTLDNFGQYRGAALGMLKTGGTPGVGPYNTLTARVVMTAGVATATSCEVHVVTDIYPQEATGMHVRRLRTTRDMGAIGDNWVQDLPRSAYGLLNLRVTDVNITRVTVIADNRYIYQDLDIRTLQIMMHDAGLTPQIATYVDVPFHLSRDLHGNLPFSGLSSLRFNFFAAAVAPGAGTVICTEELWDHVRE